MTAVTPKDAAVRHVLGLDPSSTRTGYAVLPYGYGDQVAEAGYLTGDNKRDYLDRIVRMTEQLVPLVQRLAPVVVVIELPSLNAGRKQVMRAGSLPRYGFAVGALWFAARPHAARMLGVEVNTWTRGVSKARRQAELAVEYPAYRAAMGQDGGGDVADAIGIGRWGLRTLRMEAVG